MTEMGWIQIESGTIGNLPLDLYQSGSDFMIRVDGLELMNSRCHTSEIEMARLAPAHAESILIAGLGLGYTLAAFLKRFTGPVTVVEKSSSVLEWYRRYFRERLQCDDSRVSFWDRDLEDSLKTSSDSFDLIVLDIDNGPEALSAPENENLYSTPGLRLLASRLNSRGVMMLWSSFSSAEFEERAENAGFAVKCQRIPVAGGRMDHFIYVCQVP